MSGPMAEQRDSYHHGNLRADAVAAALSLLASAPDASFTMRGVADACGVAHRAIAAQFVDRAGLEAAVAAVGYERLSDLLTDAGDTAGFLRIFAGFALANPALYALMMRQDYGAFDRHPALRANADRLIARSIATLAPTADNPTAARRQVMRFWMLLHGGVTLHRSGILHARDDAAFIDELLAIAASDTRPAALAQPLWHEQKGPNDER